MVNSAETTGNPILTKTGDGTLTLTNKANTIPDTTIENGTLKLKTQNNDVVRITDQ